MENKLTLHLLRVSGLELISARLRAGAKLRALSQDDASGDPLPACLTAEITSNRIILTLLFHKHRLCCLNGHNYLRALLLAVEGSAPAVVVHAQLMSYSLFTKVRKCGVSEHTRADLHHHSNSLHTQILPAEPQMCPASH